MSTQPIRAAAILAAALGLSACSSSYITQSWKAPGAQPLHFQKVVALAIVESPSLRRSAEDELQRQLSRVPVVQSYKVLGTEDYGDRERAKARLRQEGFDGVVAVRLVSSRQELTSSTREVPDYPYHSFSDYYGAAYPAMDVQIDTVVQVEINIYSLAEDKLVWTAMSDTYNPEGAESFIAQIVKAAREDLRKQGLIS